MIHSAPVRLACVTVMALVGFGVLSGGAVGQVVSPVAGTPIVASETARLSAADQSYLDAMNPIVTSVQDSLVRYTALAGDPQILDLDWSAKLAFELMRWRSAYQDALALEPPPGFADSHSRYLDALSLLAETSDDINAAVGDGDLAGLLQAGATMTQGIRLFDQATILMEGVVSEQGGKRPVGSLLGATSAVLAARAADLTETARSAASATPPGGQTPGQVNVMVEVNTYVGLGDLSTGDHTFQFTSAEECEEAGDEP